MSEIRKEIPPPINPLISDLSLSGFIFDKIQIENIEMLQKIMDKTTESDTTL